MDKSPQLQNFNIVLPKWVASDVTENKAHLK